MAIFDNEPVDTPDPRDSADYQAWLNARRDAGRTAQDPNVREPRANEKHAEPPKAEWGEGVVTGDPADHYVHLANGAVIPGNSGGTHYHDPDMGMVPIVNVFPAGRSLK